MQDGTRATRTTIDRTSGPDGATLPVLRFSGDISAASKESMFGAWRNVSGGGPVLLDFSKVGHIDSGGVGLIITILVEASKAGQKVAIFGLTTTNQHVFTLLGIGTLAGLHKDEQTAAASL